MKYVKNISIKRLTKVIFYDIIYLILRKKCVKLLQFLLFTLLKSIIVFILAFVSELIYARWVMALGNRRLVKGYNTKLEVNFVRSIGIILVIVNIIIFYFILRW